MFSPCWRHFTSSFLNLESERRSPFLRRWVTQKELQAAMGFPSRGALAQVAGVSGPVMFDKRQEQRLGNCMHVACIGVWQAVVLACVDKPR